MYLNAEITGKLIKPMTRKDYDKKFIFTSQISKLS